MENSGYMPAIYADAEERKHQAEQTLSPDYLTYVKGLYGPGSADDRNTAAYGNIRLYPEYLRDVSSVNTHYASPGFHPGKKGQARPLNLRMSAPLGVAPMALMKMAHPEGETAMNRAAQASGTAMVLSSFSSSSLEDVAEAGTDNLLLQIYPIKDNLLLRDIIKKAEDLGYKGLVLTVDYPGNGDNGEGGNHRVFDVPDTAKTAVITSLSDDEDNLTAQKSPQDRLMHMLRSDLQNIVKEIKKMTSLPVIAKGVMTPETAIEALKQGADGIYVSNHGGRQDTDMPATLDVLPAIAQTVKSHNPDIPVLFDGGVRTGKDAFKALYLGADIVLFGKAVLYSLAAEGELSVRADIEQAKKTLKDTMRQYGKASLKRIYSDNAARKNTAYISAVKRSRRKTPATHSTRNGEEYIGAKEAKEPLPDAGRPVH